MPSKTLGLFRELAHKPNKENPYNRELISNDIINKFNKKLKNLKQKNIEIIPYETTTLTPEQILLSNKYRPIVRPALIGKINVLAEPTISSGAITLSQNPIARPKSVESLSPLSPNTVKIVAKAILARK